MVPAVGEDQRRPGGEAEVKVEPSSTGNAPIDSMQGFSRRAIVPQSCYNRGAMTDVTQILSQIESGDPLATAQLLPLLYDELRKLAAAKLAHENPGQTLQATSLVHEAPDLAAGCV